MFIDKKVNLKNMKKNTPQYYIWINNVIDCSITIQQVKEVMKVKCPKLKITDEELQQQRRLYILLDTLHKIRRN